jgi:hypothetical protein
MGSARFKGIGTRKMGLPHVGQGPKRRPQQPPRHSPPLPYDQIRALADARKASMTTKTTFRRDDMPAKKSGAETARDLMIRRIKADKQNEPLPRFDAAPKIIRSAADARKVMLQRGA